MRNLGGNLRLELKRVHDELLSSSQILRERGEVIELLGGMAHRMQAARTDEELAQVIRLLDFGHGSRRLQMADAAPYRAKREGRNRTIIHAREEAQGAAWIRPGRRWSPG